MKVVLIHNKKFTKTSFAVSVKVGTFDSPEEYPGLAHFLEHMLFMGTKEFPGDHEFREFLEQHNGYTNASTFKDLTVYFCDIDSNQSGNCQRGFHHFSCVLRSTRVQL